MSGQPQATEGERELLETARRVLPAGGFGNVTHEVIVAGGSWHMSGT